MAAMGRMRAGGHAGAGRQRGVAGSAPPARQRHGWRLLRIEMVPGKGNYLEIIPLGWNYPANRPGGGTALTAAPHRYDDHMADPTDSPSGAGGGSTPATPPDPGERRLAHPPSDRYRTAKTDLRPGLDQAASPGRSVAFGAVAGIAGAAAIAILGGVLTVTAGLLVVAAATGWAVAMGLRIEGGAPHTGSGRVRTALTLTLVAIALGQVGLWVYGRSEGGVLAPLDFLWQVYGGLVPLEFGAAAITAWIAAR